MRVIIRGAVVLTLFCLLAATTIFSMSAQKEITERSSQSFTNDSNVASDIFVRSINNYSDILYSARSFVKGSDKVTQAEWKKFFSEQNIFQRYEGVSSIYFVEVFDEKDKQTVLQSMRRQPEFGGSSYRIQPEGTRREYAIITRYISHNDIRTSLGFDLFSTPERRVTYQAAAVKNEPVASPPLTLASGIPGFFMALPVLNEDGSQPLGYIGVSFRTHELMKALYNQNELRDMKLKITEQTIDEPTLLYASENWDDDKPGTFSRTNTIDVAGQEWQLTFQASQSYDDQTTGSLLPITIILVGGLLTLLLALCFALLFRNGGSSV